MIKEFSNKQEAVKTALTEYMVELRKVEEWLHTLPLEVFEAHSSVGFTVNKVNIFTESELDYPVLVVMVEGSESGLDLAWLYSDENFEELWELANTVTS